MTRAKTVPATINTVITPELLVGTTRRIFDACLDNRIGATLLARYREKKNSRVFLISVYIYVLAFAAIPQPKVHTVPIKINHVQASAIIPLSDK